MPKYVKIGRDIVLGTGLKAKHWSGPVVFGCDAIYICPNASFAVMKAGIDSGAAALGLFGAVGGVIAGLASKSVVSKASWKDYIVDLSDVPADVLASPDWPIRKKKRPVIMIRREMVDKIERVRGKLLVSAFGETFKLGLTLFGRGKVVATVRDLGWSI